MNLNIKGIVFLLIGLSMCLGSKGQTLEIHQISVGQGDATLIVVRDTTKLRQKLVAKGCPLPINARRYQMIVTAIDSNLALGGTVKTAILLDAGKGKEQGTKIISYMKKVGVTKVDTMLLSHFHDDHYGGFKTIINQGYKPGHVWDRGNNAPKPTRGKVKTDWIDAVTRAGAIRAAANPNATVLRLATTTNGDISMTCIAGDGYVMRSNVATRFGGVDENNFSVGWLLQYGGFRYFTGGDMNGMEFTLGDLETPMIDTLRKFDDNILRDILNDTVLGKGHVCAFKVSHHGGNESTNDYFLARMQPRVAIVSCGFSKSYYHPRIEVIRSLDTTTTKFWNTSAYDDIHHPGLPHAFRNSIKKYYVTTLMNAQEPSMTAQDWDTLYTKIGSAKRNGVIGGDILLVVDDNSAATASRFAVFHNAEKPAPALVTNGAVFVPRPERKIQYFECHRTHNTVPVNYISNH
jgi:competence protein ComEC